MLFFVTLREDILLLCQQQTLRFSPTYTAPNFATEMIEVVFMGDENYLMPRLSLIKVGVGFVLFGAHGECLILHEVYESMI